MSANTYQEDIPDQLSSVSVMLWTKNEMTAYEEYWCNDEDHETEEDNFEDHEVHNAENAKHEPPQVRGREAACMNGWILQGVSGNEPANCHEGRKVC